MTVKETMIIITITINLKTKKIMIEKMLSIIKNVVIKIETLSNHLTIKKIHNCLHD